MRPAAHLGPAGLRDFTQLLRRPLCNRLILFSDILEFGVHSPGANRGRNPMFRFDQLIRRDMIIRDVKQRHPETIPIFENLRYRDSCDDCDIETVARKNGLNSMDVLEALNEAAFGPKADENASNQ
jgi:hypothetical protein